MAGGNRAALAGAVLAALLAGCKKPEAVRVGLVAGLTGRHYDLGVSIRNGATLAVEDVNASGGVGGRRLVLLVRDDAQAPASARAAVESLVREGAVAIVGPATSSMAAEMLPIADRERILLVSPTVSSSRFQGLDDFLLMLHPSAARSAQAMSSTAAGRGHRAAVVFQDVSNEVYTGAWSDEFTADFERRGGRVRKRVPFASGKVESYADLAEEGLAAGPDVVVIVANALDTASVAQQVRKISPVQIVGTEWSFTNDLVRHGGSAVEGALFPVKVNLQDVSTPYARFRESYEARFAQPVDFAAVLAYDAVTVVAEGLRRDPTRKGLRDAILAIGRFQGLQGDVVLDATGDSQVRQLVATVRDGKQRVLE